VSGKTKKDYRDKYTRPALREKLKEQIKQSDKGGRPGQWSARKSQLLAQEYERQGGGYRGRKGKQAHSLEEWTAQNWQTREGKARARQGEETGRYLPEKAWKQLSEQEAEATDRRKRQASRTGRQYVPNTDAARAARLAVMTHQGEPTREQLYELAQALDIPGRSRMNLPQLKRAVRKHYFERIDEMNKAELDELARDLDIHNRSRMNKDQLSAAIREAI
jgi:hypothetical protein